LKLILVGVGEILLLLFLIFRQIDMRFGTRFNYQKEEEIAKISKMSVVVGSFSKKHENTDVNLLI